MGPHDKGYNSNDDREYNQATSALGRGRSGRGVVFRACECALWDAAVQSRVADLVEICARR